MTDEARIARIEQDIRDLRAQCEQEQDRLREIIAAKVGEVHARLDAHVQGEAPRWWQSGLARWGFGLLAFWGTGALLAWGLLPTYFLDSLIDAAGSALKEAPK